MTPVCWVIKRNPSYEPMKKVLFLIIGPPRTTPNSFWCVGLTLEAKKLRESKLVFLTYSNALP